MGGQGVGRLILGLEISFPVVLVVRRLQAVVRPGGGVPARDHWFVLGLDYWAWAATVALLFIDWPAVAGGSGDSRRHGGRQRRRHGPGAGAWRWSRARSWWACWPRAGCGSSPRRRSVGRCSSARTSGGRLLPTAVGIIVALVVLATDAVVAVVAAAGAEPDAGAVEGLRLTTITALGFGLLGLLDDLGGARRAVASRRTCARWARAG